MPRLAVIDVSNYRGQTYSVCNSSKNRDSQFIDDSSLDRLLTNLVLGGTLFIVLVEKGSILHPDLFKTIALNQNLMFFFVADSMCFNEKNTDIICALGNVVPVINVGGEFGCNPLHPSLLKCMGLFRKHRIGYGISSVTSGNTEEFSFIEIMTNKKRMTFALAIAINGIPNTDKPNVSNSEYALDGRFIICPRTAKKIKGFSTSFVHGGRNFFRLVGLLKRYHSNTR
jgi:hypothetical protein